VTGDEGTLFREALWEALRRRVCSVCLDRRDDGTCGLTRETRCVLEVHLEGVVAALSATRGQTPDGRARAIQDRVCRGCQEAETSGACRLGDRGECALRDYLPQIAAVVDELAVAPEALGSDGHLVRSSIEEKPQ
jgi:hypothetical protein